MALGPGKYDAELTAALRSLRDRVGDSQPDGEMLKPDAKIDGGCLLVFGRPGHNGFSCQLPLERIVEVAAVLRNIADQLEADLRRGRL